MTRKDYILVARALKDAVPCMTKAQALAHGNVGVVAAHDTIANAAGFLADRFAEDGAFDRAMFISACGAQ